MIDIWAIIIALAALLAPVAPQPAAFYKNCTEMHRDYPNGVNSGSPVYRAALDRDHDGKACEVD